MKEWLLVLAKDAKPVLDGASIGAVVAMLAGWLPSAAAFVTIAWTAIRIWETVTVQKLWARYKAWRNR